MNATAWVIAVLAVLFLMVMAFGLMCAQDKLPPDEEARLLKLEEEERKRRKEWRNHADSGTGGGKG